MTEKCTKGSHRPDCRIVESSVLSAGYSWSTGKPHRHRECTRLKCCGALPGEMCMCWPELPGGKR